MTTSTVKKTDDVSPEIGMSQENRKAVAEALSGILASTYTLYMKTLYYHWNVTGPLFHSLHALFEQHYEELHAAGDAIAERIRALGHKTPGTYHAFQKLSRVKEDQTLPASAIDMVNNLLEANEICTVHARDVLKIAEDNKDEVSLDAMVGRMSTHDEAAWMLRAITEQ